VEQWRRNSPVVSGFPAVAVDRDPPDVPTLSIGSDRES
jgi:hypothetical protein